MPNVYNNEAIMTTRILGIDPSLVKSGFGLIAVRNGEIQSWKSWSFPTNNRATIEDRVTAIFMQVKHVIINRDIHMVAMESGFIRSDHGQTSLKLGYVRAACMIAARFMERPFFEYTPQQAKQAATSRGNADKDMVIDHMTMILKASERLPSDEADALAVAFCHWNRMDEAALISASMTAGRPESKPKGDYVGRKENVEPWGWDSNPIVRDEPYRGIRER